MLKLGFFDMVAGASLFVQLVMAVLVFASILSWVLIVHRGLSLRRAWQNWDGFEGQFWHGSDPEKLHANLKAQTEDDQPSQVFLVGYSTLMETEAGQLDIKERCLLVNQSMDIAQGRILDGLEKDLSVLATIGSISPYIGLLGTVWGVMNAFSALGGLQSVTIAMVAPGISEALITTAMGLFAAIPASIAYNRYSAGVNALASKLERFGQEFVHLMMRQSRL